MIQTEDSIINITTHGGVHDYNGMFGVVIHQDGNIIATNHCKLYVPELYESSYRSEIYAMLAGLVTLRSVIDILGEDTRMNKVTIQTDNKSLLKRPKKTRREFKMTANDYRNADIDIVLQLLEEFKSLEEKTSQVTMTYIKGHQKTLNNTLVGAIAYVRRC
jgi:ribonuclease HI